ncbi:hypothetical protein [Actinomadura sp. NEAU-AAG7]|uniref:hypothetical protein n=1 Tax=Actinomadura sp. NEAU-AAG7 TaxID=2839640 RepID=UPI001BE3D660|nr:hypothetical protein [Actinomadura sp. NEAU-AAG7]MBT2207035.1 hypothetical protein [Actinomadura sp. NEAU-AAG7]
MVEKPTERVTSTPGALPHDQRDGTACADCGTVQYEYRPNDNDRRRMECPRDHQFPTAEPMTEAGRRADAERQDERQAATVPGSWPDGEAPGVRDMSSLADDFERQAKRSDDLADGLTDLAERIEQECPEIASAGRQAAEAHRVLAGALRAGDETLIERALANTDAIGRLATELINVTLGRYRRRATE